MKPIVFIVFVLTLENEMRIFDRFEDVTEEVEVAREARHEETQKLNRDYEDDMQNDKERDQVVREAQANLEEQP